MLGNSLKLDLSSSYEDQRAFKDFPINCSGNRNSAQARVSYYSAVNELLRKGWQAPEAPVVVKVTRLSGSRRTQESDPAFKNPIDITLADVQGAAVMT